MTTNSTNLRDRARGGQVARRPVDPEKKRVMNDQIGRMESQFKLAMPKGMEAKQLIRDAMTVLSTTPKLAECDQTSVLGALMTCAQLGLRPGVLGQAWVIPFKGKGQLIIGYQGLVTLAQRSGDIASISARIVYQNDLFEYEYGLNDRLIHRPTEGDPGAAKAYYCVVKSTKGGVYWEVMNHRAAELFRDEFAMARDYESSRKGEGPHGKGFIIGPWRDHFDAMALKTVVKRALHLAPRSTELMQAMVADESIRVDLMPDAEISTSLVDIPENMPDDVVDGELDDDLPPEGQDPTMQPGWGEGNA